MTAPEYTYNLLIVDDESYICSIVTEALSAIDHYHVISFSEPKKALTYIEENRVDLVLTDLVMGDFSGVDLMDSALKYHPDCIVILMTAYPTVNNAISVLKRGAYDYLVKPFKLETLKNTVKRGLERQGLARENLHLKEQLGIYRLSEAMGTATSLQAILNLAADSARSVLGIRAISVLVREKDSATPVPCLIKGEPDDEEAVAFLQGNHDLCRAALNDLEHRTDSREIEKPEKKIRSLVSHPLMIRGQVTGLLNVVLDDPYMPIMPGQTHLLSIIASKVASAIENNRLQEHLRSSYLKAIKALANAIEARDRHTRGHTDRVTILADLVASRLDWSDEKRAELRMGCTLHDIGKIGVPDAILNKPGSLTPQEREQIEAHPALGARMLEGIDYLRRAIPYILNHHEHFDGSGYPNGLAGENIPIEGRLLAVVDTFDAIVSERPYRPGAPAEDAIEELLKFRGRQFDPVIVDIFVEIWKEGLIESLGIYPAAAAPAPAQ